MKNLTIFQRLVLSYIAIFVVVVAFGGYITVKLIQLNKITSSISSSDIKIIRLSNLLRDSFISQTGFGKKYIISGDHDFYDQFFKAEESIQKNLLKLRVLLSSDEKNELISKIERMHDLFLDIIKKEFDKSSSRVSPDIEKNQAEKEYYLNRIVGSIEKIIVTAKTDVDEKIQESEKLGVNTLKLTVIINATAMIMAFIIAFFNARIINRSIIDLMKGTRAIARGEFKKHLEIDSPPEIHELADAFNLMSDRLKELDEMKDDFIAHVSHELRTPLTVIREASDLLFEGMVFEGMAETQEDKQVKLLTIISEECERLIGFVNRTLDLSKMDAGMMEYVLEKCNIASLIRENISKIQPVVEKKRIIITNKVPSDLPHGKVDMEKIGLVIGNLLGNAVKFTPEGGEVTVAAYYSKGKKKKFIEIAVSDTGCGIDANDMKHIFSKFMKVKGKGTGLGLSIAKHIVNAHGGEIWSKSKPGKGSSFYFTVPVF